MKFNILLITIFAYLSQLTIADNKQQLQLQNNEQTKLQSIKRRLGACNSKNIAKTGNTAGCFEQPQPVCDCSCFIVIGANGQIGNPIFGLGNKFGVAGHASADRLRHRVLKKGKKKGYKYRRPHPPIHRCGSHVHHYHPYNHHTRYGYRYSGGFGYNPIFWANCLRLCVPPTPTPTPTVTVTPPPSPPSPSTTVRFNFVLFLNYFAHYLPHFIRDLPHRIKNQIIAIAKYVYYHHFAPKGKHHLIPHIHPINYQEPGNNQINGLLGDLLSKLSNLGNLGKFNDYLGTNKKEY